MASPINPEISNADLTTCPICLEQMKVPKCLPCLHSFCETCIVAYCEHFTAASGNQQTLECPVCRSVLNYTKPKGTSETLLVSPEKWVQTLPLNFLIVELLERKQFESTNKMCFSCERLGEKSGANNFCKECGELLCEMCTKYHRANKLTATHNIHLFTELSRDELKNFKQCCNWHPGEMLKLYCCDHEIECCSLCVSVDHRKCETVQTIEIAAKDICQSDLPKKIKETLVCNKQKLKILRERFIEDSKKYEDQVLSIVEELNDFRRDIKTKVDIISDKLTAELTQFSENSDRKHRSMVVELDSKIASIDNELSIFATVFEKASNVQIMATLKELEKKSPLHTKFTNDITNNYSHSHLTSNVSKELDEINNALEKCMVSTISNRCEFPFTCNSLPSVQLKLITKIKRKDRHNEACFSSDGNIFVADYLSKCIDVYHIDSKKLNTVQLEYSPHNLASDGHGYIALLNEEEGTIEFLNEKTLIIDQRISVSKKSYGISLNEKFLVVRQDERIECYDRLKGTLYSKVEGLPGLDSSSDVHVNKKGFYFSCGDIIHFKTFPDLPEGESGSFIYTDHSFEDVGAVATDDKGNVYYADSEADTIGVMSFDGSRSYAFEVQEELIRPAGLCLSKDQKNLLVTKDMGKTIYMYEIEKDGDLEVEADEKKS
ncbi:tripartite motif-containing protein 2-like [Mytilus edulis]|uniref:tripartite motif-containing protein 2-like n=1 Tax=Mytilus edulis TaxID=6550 RepID=UPI0039EFAD90